MQKLFSGDGRADYIRIHTVDGSMDLYTNVVGVNPANWLPQGSVASGVGSSGPSIQFGILTNSGRADYIPVVPASGGISPYLNGCKNPITSPGGGGGGTGGGGTGGGGTGGGGTGGGGTGGGGTGGGGTGGGGTGGGGSGGGGGASGPGSGTVLVPPSIWSNQNPVLQCVPPCVFVLPPYQLSSTTTINFPLYTTTLDVAWLTTVTTTIDGKASTIQSYTRTLEKTVLTIPPGKNSHYG